VVYLILLLFLLVGGVLAWITWQNLSTPAQLVLFNWQTPHIPVGLWLVGCFLLGALLFYLIAFFSAMSERRELKALRGRVAELEQEKANAQAASANSMAPVSSSSATGPLPPPGPNPSAGMRPPTGPLTSSSPYIPMPGLPGQTPPQNSGSASSAMPDFRQ
jgi:uncharacterized integral membrane protein